MIHIGYYRNELLLAARAEKNKSRQNFIAWTVALLRARQPENIDQDTLLAAWHALPSAEKLPITTPSARAYFRTCGGRGLQWRNSERVHLGQRRGNQLGAGLAPSKQACVRLLAPAREAHNNVTLEKIGFNMTTALGRRRNIGLRRPPTILWGSAPPIPPAQPPELVSLHQTLLQPERSPAATRSEFRT
jgi:hypothetical protein